MTRIALLGLTCLLAACDPPRIVAPLPPAPLTMSPDEPFRAKPPPIAAVVEKVDAVRTTHLSNGVEVALVERHDYPVVAARLLLDRGSIALDDAGGLAVAQMTKLFARGGDEATYQRLSESSAATGAIWSVGENRDSSWVDVKAPSASFDAMITLLAAVSIAPRLTAAEHDRVSAVLQRTADWKPISVASKTLSVLFGERPYGTKAATTPIALEDAQTLHDRIFQPAHATLVIAGDVSPEAVDRAVGGAFTAWSARWSPVARWSTPPAALNGPRVGVVSRRNSAQRLGGVFARGPEGTSDDVEALEVAVRVLGGNKGSALYGRLREESGAAYAVQASFIEMRTASYVSVTASMDADKAVDGVRDILAAIDDLRSERTTDEELAIGRETLLGQWRRQMSTVAGTAATYAQWIARGRDPSRLAEQPSRIARLRREDLERVARTYLASESLHVILAGEDRWLDVRPLGMGGAAKL